MGAASILFPDRRRDRHTREMHPGLSETCSPREQRMDSSKDVAVTTGSSGFIGTAGSKGASGQVRRQLV